jgi:hypothetical protein
MTISLRVTCTSARIPTCNLLPFTKLRVLNKIIGLLDFFHFPIFCGMLKNTAFRKRDLFPTSDEDLYRLLCWLPYYEEEEREVGSSERHYGWGEQNISSIWRFPVIARLSFW